MSLPVEVVTSDRPVRRRQDDAASLVNFLEAYDGGSIRSRGAKLAMSTMPAARSAASRSRRHAGRNGHGVPELQPVPAPDGRAERHAGTRQVQEAVEGRAGDRPALAHRVGLAHKTGSLPSELSGGSSSASALPGPSRWIPRSCCSTKSTSALDPELVNEVVDVVAAANDGMTMLIVTHEIAFAGMQPATASSSPPMVLCRRTASCRT